MYEKKIGFWKGSTGSASFGSSEGHFDVSFYGSPSSDFKIIGTDYVNYSIVYGCEPGPIGAVENLWILSRDVTLSQEKFDEAVAIINEKLPLYNWPAESRSTLQSTDESVCPYSTQPGLVTGYDTRTDVTEDEIFATVLMQLNGYMFHM